MKRNHNSHFHILYLTLTPSSSLSHSRRTPSSHPNTPSLSSPHSLLFFTNLTSRSQFRFFQMSKPTGRTNLASCIVATIFLIFVIIVILIVFFTVFKPKDPKISVNAIQLPSFSVANNSVNFTFSQYVAVTNPNRASFSHYDSTIQLVYSGSQVGFMFIPAGQIDAGRTKYMAATFAVQSFPISSSSSAAAAAVVVTPPTFVGGGFGIGGTNNGYRVGPTMEIESRMELAGRVRVLHFFTHHVKAKSGCRVQIAVSDGSVLGFHC